MKLPLARNVDVAVPPNCAELAENTVDEAPPMNFCSPVHVLATEKSHANAPDTPPTNDPSVPEYVIGEVTVGVEVPIVATLPFVVVYVTPEERVGRNRFPLIVVDEFEKRPL